MMVEVDRSDCDVGGKPGALMAREVLSVLGRQGRRAVGMRRPVKARQMIKLESARAGEKGGAMGGGS